ncbi:hypothetical protein VNI00_009762 [Paramarasmius palmivorus]|uniref:Uncharacterized protein n=1 Tax=Paramarasmius palmivorus TaxID=297713 RepID=A0AAW0CKS8_9AGAR
MSPRDDEQVAPDTAVTHNDARYGETFNYSRVHDKNGTSTTNTTVKHFRTHNTADFVVTHNDSDLLMPGALPPSNTGAPQANGRTFFTRNVGIGTLTNNSSVTPDSYIESRQQRILRMQAAEAEAKQRLATQSEPPASSVPSQAQANSPPPYSSHMSPRDIAGRKHLPMRSAAHTQQSNNRIGRTRRE